MARNALVWSCLFAWVGACLGGCGDGDAPAVVESPASIADAAVPMPDPEKPDPEKPDPEKPDPEKPEPEKPDPVSSSVSAAPVAPGELPAFLEEMGDGWVNLIQGKWSIAPAGEGYICVRYTLPEAIAFKRVKPVSPLGTHHTVLSYDDEPVMPDGTAECGALENGVHVLFASGVGTDASEPLPDGVAFQLPKGAQLVLNLHLFNATESELSGVSGNVIQPLPNGEDQIPAENMLSGPVMLNIPPGRVVQSGRCTFQGDSTIVQIFPHMHQLGVYMKAVAHSSIVGEVVLHDGPYSFEEQLFYPVEPVPMAKDDYVTVECTYQNDTDETVHWGDSSTAEMCFVGLVRYPALGPTTNIGCLD